jgi:hypothetical protein
MMLHEHRQHAQERATLAAGVMAVSRDASKSSAERSRIEPSCAPPSNTKSPVNTGVSEYRYPASKRTAGTALSQTFPANRKIRDSLFDQTALTGLISAPNHGSTVAHL